MSISPSSRNQVQDREHGGGRHQEPSARTRIPTGRYGRSWSISGTYDAHPWEKEVQKSTTLKKG